MNDETNQKEKTSYSSIRFYVRDNMLMASFEQNSTDSPIDEKNIRELLENTDLDKHLLDSEIINHCIDLSEENHQGEITIEEHCDASFELIIDETQMTASIVIKQACGGGDLNYDDVVESILEQSIHKDFLDTDTLAKSLTDILDETPIIAKGIAATNGEKSRFEILFDPDSTIVPKQNSDGSIDHYETHDYITVKCNQPLMRRIPHTQGTPGYSVLGEKIKNEPGEEIKFILDDSVKVDTSDPNLLLAAIDGHPVVSENTVHIDNTLTLKSANLNSGNVYFDGSVQILGEVKPNVVIEARGDVFINGMVENATIISGNNITVKGGVISSHLDDDDDDDDDIYSKCILNAKGTINVNYCNGISAKAENDILIDNYSMHSKLESKKSIVFGTNNGKGIAIGGIIIAKQNISANIIGSDAYVKTEVICGSLSALKKQRGKVKDNIKRSKNEIRSLNIILDKIKRSGTPVSVGNIILKKAKKINKKIKKMKYYLAKQNKIRTAIKKELKVAGKYNISVNNKIHSNVQISINDVQTINNKNRGPSIISCEDHDIQFN